LEAQEWLRVRKAQVIEGGKSRRLEGNGRVSSAGVTVETL